MFPLLYGWRIINTVLDVSVAVQSQLINNISYHVQSTILKKRTTLTQF